MKCPSELAIFPVFISEHVFFLMKSQFFSVNLPFSQVFPSFSTMNSPFVPWKNSEAPGPPKLVENSSRPRRCNGPWPWKRCNGAAGRCGRPSRAPERPSSALESGNRKRVVVLPQWAIHRVLSWGPQKSNNSRVGFCWWYIELVFICFYGIITHS